MQTRNRRGGLYREMFRSHPDHADRLWTATAIRMLIRTGGTGDLVAAILDSRSGRHLGEEIITTAKTPDRLLRNIEAGVLDHKIILWYNPGTYTLDEQDEPLNPTLRQEIESVAQQVTGLAQQTEDWAVKERLWGCLKLLQEIRDRQ